jgi:tetratricopeptide (TPR) repeat protein
LVFRDRPEEGRAYARKAIAALEQAGGVNRVRASLAKASFQVDQFDEASVDFAETMAVLEEASQFLRAPASGAPPESLAALDFMRAWALMTRGDYESAGPLAQASAPTMLQATQSLGKEFSVSAVLGECARNLGDHESADKHLRRALELRLQMGTGNHPFAAVDWANAANNLSMAGRHQEAEALLARAPNFENLQGSTLSSYSDVIPEIRSRIRMDAGDVEGARALLPETDKHVGDTESAVRALNEFYELRGEIRCASGERVSGLMDLRRSIDLQLKYSSPSHPFLARTRAIAGLCSLAHGDRKIAEAFAGASRQAFIAQPNVSPYFKEPLKRLEKQLGRKPS